VGLKSDSTRQGASGIRLEPPVIVTCNSYAIRLTSISAERPSYARRVTRPGMQRTFVARLE
ncbi:MAG: hypothetical protein IKT27_02030, partial [Clostridia bacterium]|nr:hypothetical protein [Clostridia bacterium]